MAFSGAEREEIYSWLGWGARFHQTDSALFQALNAIEQNPESETYVKDKLMPPIRTQFEKVFDEDTVQKLFKANGVGSIEVSSGSGHDLAQRLNTGKMLVGRLASYLGVSVRHDVFAPTLPRTQAGYYGRQRPNGTTGGW